jgi:hypothetical protein
MALEAESMWSPCGERYGDPLRSALEAGDINIEISRQAAPPSSRRSSYLFEHLTGGGRVLKCLKRSKPQPGSRYGKAWSY